MKKMNVNKFLKLSLIILIIIFLSIISFVGIYIQDKNVMSNIVKDYKLGMDLKGSRRIELEVSDKKETIKYDAEGKVIDSSDTKTEAARTEEKPANAEEVLTSENYSLTKKILEGRLKKLGVQDYLIRLDENTGKIVVEIPEDDNTDTIVAQMQYQGKFEIVDADTNEVLMTNDDLKSVKAGYGTNSYGNTTIYLNFQFNKEGTNKFKDITNKYVETTVTSESSKENQNTTVEETNTESTKTESTNTENTNTESENQASEPKTTTVKKQVKLEVDDSTLITTYFDSEITNGLLQLSVGSKSNATSAELKESLINANSIAALLDNGQIPVVYEITQNRYVASEVQSDNIGLFIALSIIAATAGMIYLIIKFKEKGILTSIGLVGYIAILLLVLRYTNVIITIDGLVAIVLSIVLAYMAIIKILKYNEKIEDKKEAFNRAMKKLILIYVPIAVIAVVFTFNTWLPIFSFGMVMFWGLVINVLYNLIFTRLMLIED